jgi:hypothetical protein
VSAWLANWKPSSAPWQTFSMSSVCQLVLVKA